MKKLSLSFFVVVFMATLIQGQSCDGPFTTATIHGNNIRTQISNRGDMFWDAGAGDATFQVPYTGAQTPSSIFVVGLVMGGIDPGGNLKLAAQSYGAAQGDADYWAGPLGPNTGATVVETCYDYEQIWSVRRHEIEAHLADLADNGTLDHPLPAIMAWPAMGNPHFMDIHGFELPDGQEMAPYFDANQDAVYRPEDGDYPLPTSVHPSVIPEQVLWTVFNDNGNIHSESSATPVQAEIQLTTWALTCQDNPILNHTLFTSHKIINRALESIDSFHVGLFTDFDLGCYTDDFIGSNPTENSFFVYNADAVDGQVGASCPQGINTYAGVPPVQAITLLNHDLNALIYSENGAVGTPSPGTTTPSTAIEYYHYLTGSWRDGSPITTGGNGYMTGEPTNFVFPDSPNAPDGWSMLNNNLPEGDRRTFSSTDFGRLDPGQIIQIDHAYSFHQDPNGTHLTNVDKMYAEVPQLRAMYNNQFQNHCEQMELCEEDCIWAGDANADGVANHCDLLPMAVALGQQGVNRIPPYHWFPSDGEAWQQELPQGTNYKHIDANGNGIVTQSDFDLTINHYDLTTPSYQALDEYTVGPELYFEAAGSTDINAINDGMSLVRLILETTEPVYGLALTIEYDTRYIERLQPLAGGDWVHIHQRSGELDYAISRIDGMSTLEAGELMPIFIHTLDEFDAPLPSPQTSIRVKNIKALRNDGTSIELGSTDLEVTFVDVPTSTKEVDLQAFRIYPVPTVDRLMIENQDIALKEIWLMDAMGKVVQKRVALTGFEQQLDMTNLPKGVYFLKLYSEEKNWVKKVVKQ